MSATNDGGPAFARSGFLSPIEKPEQLIAAYENKPSSGMTLRDWFAGQALARTYEEMIGSSIHSSRWEKCAASQAYKLADAMLAERAKREASK